MGNSSYSIFLPQEDLPRSLKQNPNINSWLQVLQNGKVIIFTGKHELGQGIRVAMAQVAAEELNMDPSKIEVHLAETGITPDEGYTAGSGSMDNSAMAIRYAAAAAKMKLLDIASKKYNLEVDAIAFLNGNVSAPQFGTISFHELLQGQQISEKVTTPVKLKSKRAYTVVGKKVLRQDISEMVRAKMEYVHDLRFPGMVHARIVRPPSYTSWLLSFDETELKSKVPGFLKVVANGTFLAVLASDEFAAVQAQKILKANCKWSPVEKLASGGHSELKAFLKSLPAQKDSLKELGKVNLTEENGYTVHRAEYFKPYLMHGSIGPSCSVGFYESDQLHIWSHSQGIYPLQESIAKMLSISSSKIHIKAVPGSGCYGHNGADDASAEVALIAMAYPGKHVRLQWSREDEHGWEPYGSAMLMELEARLDSNNKITDWHLSLWSDTHGTRPGGEANNLLPARYLEKPVTKKPAGFSGGAYRNAEPYYAIPNQKIDMNFFQGPLRTSSLRSLGAYGNIFAIECFMDELAGKAKADVFDFRLMHLEDERAKAVLIKLRELVKGKEKPGSSIGIAFSRYKNTASYCAAAAQVRITPEKNVRVEKMWSVIDAGETINPDGVMNQTEGGMIQAASWTIQEQVKFNSEFVTSVNWDGYPIFRFDQVPETEVVIIDHPEEGPMGAGEAVQGPAGAAVVNAVSKAIGKRIRNLPVLPLG